MRPDSDPPDTDRSAPAPTLPSHPAASAASCATVAGGLSDEEVAILARLRALRAEATAVRVALAALAAADGAGAGPGDALAARLAALRAAWHDLARERDAARHRRMVALGHEEVPPAGAPPDEP